MVHSRNGAKRPPNEYTSAVGVFVAARLKIVGLLESAGAWILSVRECSDIIT